MKIIADEIDTKNKKINVFLLVIFYPQPNFFVDSSMYAALDFNKQN